MPTPAQIALIRRLGVNLTVDPDGSVRAMTIEEAREWADWRENWERELGTQRRCLVTDV